MRSSFRPGDARHAATLFVALVLAAGTASSAAPGRSPSLKRDPPDPRYVAGEILVKFRSGTPAASRAALRFEVAGAARHRFASGAELWHLEAGLPVPDAIARLKGAPGIEYAEPNYLLHATRIPDDPLFPQQYAL